MPPTPGSKTTASTNVFGSTLVIPAHTVDVGDDLILIVRISLISEVGSPQLTSTVVHDAAGTPVSLTRAPYGPQSANIIGAGASLWYLVNPPVGTKDITITLVGSESGIIAEAQNYSDVNQTSPFFSTATGYDNTGDFDPDVTVGGDAGNLAIDVLTTVHTTLHTTTPGAGQTQDSQLDITTTGGAPISGRLSTSHKNAASPVNMTWNSADGVDAPIVAQVGICLRGADYAPTPVAMDVAQGTYLGDGLINGDFQDIMVGFTPKFVMGAGDAASNGHAFYISDTMSVGQNLVNGSDVSGIEIIAGGFRVTRQSGDATAKTNEDGVDYYYAAFGGSGVETGQYTGTQATNPITGVGFPPEAFIVSRNSAIAYFRTRVMKDRSMTFSGSGEIDEIVSLDSDGATIGASNETNLTSATYNYTAFAYAVNFHVGAYISNGVDGRDLPDTPFPVMAFDPHFALIKQDAGQVAVFKVLALAGDLTKSCVTGVAVANMIQSLSPAAGQFEVGTEAETNPSSIEIDYFFIAASADVSATISAQTATATAQAHGADSNALPANVVTGKILRANIISAEVTFKLDAAGSWKAVMPLTDPKTAAVELGHIWRHYREGEGLVHAGLIENISINPDGNLEISGPLMLAELLHRNVFFDFNTVHEYVESRPPTQMATLNPGVPVGRNWSINALTDPLIRDGVYAYVQGDPAPQNTWTLAVYDFGFSLSPTAVVMGIQVAVYKACDPGGPKIAASYVTDAGLYARLALDLPVGAAENLSPASLAQAAYWAFLATGIESSPGPSEVPSGQTVPVGGWTNSATNLLVTSSAAFKVGQWISSQLEALKITSIPDGTHINVQRAKFGTSAQAHTAGSIIYILMAPAVTYGVGEAEKWGWTNTMLTPDAVNASGFGFLLRPQIFNNAPGSISAKVTGASGFITTVEGSPYEGLTLGGLGVHSYNAGAQYIRATIESNTSNSITVTTDGWRQTNGGGGGAPKVGKTLVVHAAPNPIALVDYIEITVFYRDADLVDVALDNLLALAPAWTVVGTAGTAQYSGKFDGDSVLRAVLRVVESVPGLHFREDIDEVSETLPLTRQLEIGEFGEDSGYTVMQASNAPGEPPDKIAYIDTLTVITQVQDTWNVVAPVGSGQGEAQVNMRDQDRLPNLILNSSFEQTLDNWTAAGGLVAEKNATYVVNGKGSVLLTGGGTFSQLTPVGSGPPNIPFILEAWLFPLVHAGAITVSLQFANSGGTLLGSALTFTLEPGILSWQRVGLEADDFYQTKTETAPTASRMKITVTLTGSDSVIFDAVRVWAAATPVATPPAAPIPDAPYDVYTEINDVSSRKPTMWFYLQDEYSIQGDGVFLGYGRRERVLSNTAIAPIANTKDANTIASNALYDAAASYLLDSRAVQRAFQLSTVGLPNSDCVKVGDKIHIRYRGVAETDTGAFTYLTLEDDLYVLERTRSFTDDGQSRDRFVVSDLARALTSSDATIVGRVGDSSTSLSVKAQTYPAVYLSPSNLMLGDDPSTRGGIKHREGNIRIESSEIDVTTTGLKTPAEMLPDVLDDEGINPLIPNLEDITLTVNSENTLWRYDSLRVVSINPDTGAITVEMHVSTAQEGAAPAHIVADISATTFLDTFTAFVPFTAVKLLQALLVLTPTGDVNTINLEIDDLNVTADDGMDGPWESPVNLDITRYMLDGNGSVSQGSHKFKFIYSGDGQIEVTIAWMIVVQAIKI